MKTIHLPMSLLCALFLSACQPTAPVDATSGDDASYSSATFSPSPQYKTHHVAAFVEPTNQASMSFQVSGIIAEQFIKIGDQVEAGEELFRVSNPTLVPQINQFKNQIKAIEATIQQNQTEVQRFKELKKTNVISQNDLDRLANQTENLKATKKSLESQLQQAKSLFDETYLRASFAGNIAEIYKAAGEVISPGEAILVVSGVNSFEAAIYLPAFLHKNLTFGQSLEVSHQKQLINATIKEISSSANPNSQLFKVILDVPIEHEINSGEKIQVQIKEKLGDFYRLPIESVIDDGINEPFVFIIDDNQVQQSRIELIDIEGDEVIVKMSQSNTVEVITGGQAKLSPKQKLARS